MIANIFAMRSDTEVSRKAKEWNYKSLFLGRWKTNRISKFVLFFYNKYPLKSRLHLINQCGYNNIFEVLH